MKSNKDKVRELVIEMLKDAIPHIEKTIEKALDSGEIDLDNWDENCNKMVLPKIILIAVLEEEADQYKPYGNSGSLERQVKSGVKKLKNFL